MFFFLSLYFISSHCASFFHSDSRCFDWFISNEFHFFFVILNYSRIFECITNQIYYALEIETIVNYTHRFFFSLWISKLFEYSLKNVNTHSCIVYSYKKKMVCDISQAESRNWNHQHAMYAILKNISVYIHLYVCLYVRLWPVTMHVCARL